MARETWTDERLDDLNRRVDAGFAEMREEFRAVRAEMRGEFRAVRAEAVSFRAEVGQQFAAQDLSRYGGCHWDGPGPSGAVTARIPHGSAMWDSRRGRIRAVSWAVSRGAIPTEIGPQQRMMIQLFGGMFATVALGFLGVIATILAQA